jgi:amino acid transporter
MKNLTFPLILIGALVVVLAAWIFWLVIKIVIIALVWAVCIAILIYLIYMMRRWWMHRNF